jgi:hypothetical protein
MTTQTQTQVREEPPYIHINLVTGHAMNVDEDTTENICRALGSDHADPPNERQTTTIPCWQFQVPGNAGRQPFHPPPQPPPRHPEGGGGGGSGGGSGGDGGGGLPAPAGPGLFPLEYSTGNPRVFFVNPYPYPQKPVTRPKGTGFHG